MSATFVPVRPGLHRGARPERAAAPPVARLENYLQAWLVSRRRGARSPVSFRPTLERIHTAAGTLRAADEPARRRWRRRLREAAGSGDALSEAQAVDAFAQILVDAEALFGITLHDEQLFAGWAMLHGGLVEMRTGEGKTLAAALPAIAVALTGTPVHVITANDYLAARDAENLRALYERFGLTVASVGEQDSIEARAQAYRGDVVYGAGKQLVFDYLHDARGATRNGAGLGERLRPLLDGSAPPTLLRGLCFAVVDEADSVLVDDARTPLVLSEPLADDPALRARAIVALTIARSLHADVDYRADAAGRSVQLSLTGREAVRLQTQRLKGVWQRERYRETLVGEALAALHLYRSDHDYLVRDGRVVLIDAPTGRPQPDRKLRHGLHQMLELKEGCELGARSDVVAALSFQRFFGRYHGLCGMSGTLDEVHGELRTVYRLAVTRVPTHRPCRLTRLPSTIVPDRETQLEALSSRLMACRRAGRPVLVGTRSLDLAEWLGARLGEAGIEHRRLDARHDGAEAAVIGEAGQPGAITLATGMAGRGSDIPLHPRSRAAGGLHVVSLELHDSPRTERQLFGRAARQGDPGSCESLYCLDDETLAGNVAPGLLATARRLGPLDTAPGRWLARALFAFGRRRIAARHAHERMALFHRTEAELGELAVSGG